MLGTVGHLVRKILIPSRYKTAHKLFKKSSIVMLDVGCGNEGYYLAKRWFKSVQYHGVDRGYYMNDEATYEKFDKFFKLDLETSDLSEIENKKYDFILASHVVEHIDNAHSVLQNLALKLKPGGVIYIETPSFRTLNYPSAEGFLNFYDDPTHKVIHTEVALAQTLMSAGLKVIKAKTRRDWLRCLIFGPLALVANLFFFIPFKRRLQARGLWDLLGVAISVEAIAHDQK